MKFYSVIGLLLSTIGLIQARPNGYTDCKSQEISPGKWRFNCDIERGGNGEPPTINLEHILWIQQEGGLSQDINIEIPNYKINEVIKAGFKGSPGADTRINVLVKKPEVNYNAEVDKQKPVSSNPSVVIQYEPVEKILVHYPVDKEYVSSGIPIEPPPQPRPTYIPPRISDNNGDSVTKTKPISDLDLPNLGDDAVPAENPLPDVNAVPAKDPDADAVQDPLPDAVAIPDPLPDADAVPDPLPDAVAIPDPLPDADAVTYPLPDLDATLAKDLLPDVDAVVVTDPLPDADAAPVTGPVSDVDAVPVTDSLPGTDAAPVTDQLPDLDIVPVKDPLPDIIAVSVEDPLLDSVVIPDTDTDALLDAARYADTDAADLE